MKEKTFVEKTMEFSKNLTLDIVKNLLVFENLDSTNSTAKNLARAGADEGTVVVAQTQSHGRGRFDRIWQSPKGGVYLSIILRPQIPVDKASLLPLLTALAVAKTIDLYGIHATIKWPNDVRVNKKKIAGILLELESTNNTIHYVVVGLGINLHLDITQLSPEVQSQSTSLTSELGQSVDYHQFLGALFQQFDEIYMVFRQQKYKRLIDEWKKHSDTLGNTIWVKTPTETIQGTAYDIDKSGFLLVRTKTGTVKKILSGDCLYFDEVHKV
ncbi:MAG: biotin--[acetyl-CoA-carboxylase] ligase [Thermoplasmata archaeon M9B2D]|nr:MAG: biotin--[acetyl-CoA-carboxylase] ligase [Thermoplasmata archaeon M9B2D]